MSRISPASYSRPPRRFVTKTYVEPLQVEPSTGQHPSREITLRRPLPAEADRAMERAQEHAALWVDGPGFPAPDGLPIEDLSARLVTNAAMLEAMQCAPDGSTLRDGEDGRPHPDRWTAAEWVIASVTLPTIYAEALETALMLRYEQPEGAAGFLPPAPAAPSPPTSAPDTTPTPSAT